jgi:hypothetical protein
MTEQCRKTGIWDIVAIAGLSIGEKAIEFYQSNEQQKPSYQRNDVGVFWGDVGKIILGIAKFAVTRNLCDYRQYA